MNTGKNQKRKPNPRQNANFFSAATFGYILPTYIEGYRKGFDENDIYETVDTYRSDVLGNKIEALWNTEMKKAKETKRNPSLIRVLIYAFGRELLLLGLMGAVMEFLVLPARALIVGRLVSLYSPTKGENSYQDGFGVTVCAALIIALTILNIALLHPFMTHCQLVGLKAKIACCSLIYRKALRLNNAAFSKTNVGQMVNLLANDVVIFVRCTLMLNYLWIGPTQCFIVTYLMYREVGFSSIVGVLLILLSIPFLFFLGKLASKYRSKTAIRTDERVRVLNEIISGIQVIKMYAWEKPIESLLMSLRNFEMKYTKLSMYTKALYISFDILIIQIVLNVTIIVYVLHNDISAAKVFTLIIFYDTLKMSMGTLFPQGLAFAAETMISVKRINAFLLNSEIEISDSTGDNANPVAISISDGTAKWKTEVTLHDFNLTVKRGSLTAIIGQVGCGKSSLLNLVLKELPLVSGEIVVNGKVSYAPQDSWLFGGSVRDNILFGAEMDVARYNEVVRACALECDFNSFPFADNTIIGGRGTSLSGGQKARINLARAIYRDADIYLLDGPFSAVDARVGKQIFQECIKRFLKGKTVVLVTHQLQFLKEVDEVIMIDSGTIISEGQWTGKEGIEYLQDDKDLNDTTMLDEYGNGKTENIQKVEKEQTSTGSVSSNVYFTYITSSGSPLFIFTTIVMVLLSQTMISGGHYFLAHWVNVAEMRNVTTPTMINEDVEKLSDGYSKKMNIYVYSTITVTAILVTLIRSIMFFSCCLTSSTKLHNNMLSSIIRASMRFFNTNSQGRIINRFSQDMQTVDTQLSSAAIITVKLLAGSMASVLLVAIVNYWLLIPTAIIATILYSMKSFCMVTSRSIKRLEGTTRSPVFEHLSSSLQGLNTIRAFRSERILMKEFDSHQDLHSSCYHLFVSTSQGLGSFLDYVCCLYVIIVTASFAVSDIVTLGGNVGLAITQCFYITTYLQWAVRQLAELENQMTSVERILEYNSIEHEENCNGKAPVSWPTGGQISFLQVYLKYSLSDPPVLKNVTFQIEPREKIGIVGRTGAGKSSIVNALFRLSYITGDILIDNVSIKNLNLQELRSKVTIIPQDPVLFTGTLRSNLDQFEEFDDSDLWTALEQVEIKDYFASLPLGLDYNITHGGTNVSVGQRQLICLARAILRNNKILVLDEATASIDSETDKLIQKTIRTKFEHCTVITIAHRLETIMDYDKIIVMSAGELVEFDTPAALLQNVDGYFYQMVHHAPKDAGRA